MEIDKAQLPSDDFSRNAIAEKLVKIILSEKNISPVMINGDWGTGKTVLANRIRNRIIEHHNDTTCVYFNAFQEDHSENALISLVAAVASVLPKERNNKLINAAKPALRFVLKTGTKALVSHITRQDIDKLGEDASKAFSEITNSAIDNTIDSLIKDHIESEKNISVLKEMLSEQSEDKKIVIIIDELDRCNPYFAIDIIEKIKYIFDMDNIKFILIANRKQLESSINNKYGGVNSQSYIEKFIRLSIDLPVNIQQYENSYNASSIYFKKLMGNSDFLRDFPSKIRDEISDIISLNKISLREVEYLMRNIDIYNILSDNGLSNKYLPIVRTYRVLFVLIYTFSNRFNITEQEIIQNPSILMNIVGLRYDTKSPNITALMATAMAELEYDKQKRMYINTSGELYNIELRNEFNELNSKSLSGDENYSNLLLSVFNTLSFF